MIDPLDLVLSEFIDELPEDWQDADRLLNASLRFHGKGDLPALAHLAALVRATEPPSPSAVWMAASKERLMNAAVHQPAYHGLGLGLAWAHSKLYAGLQGLHAKLPTLPPITGLGSLLPPLATAGRAVAAFAMIATAGVTAYHYQDVVPGPGTRAAAERQTQTARQAITLAQRQVSDLGGADATGGDAGGAYIKGSPKDVVLLAKFFSAADLAIDDAPADQQPQLRAQLHGVVRAVRFEGFVESVTPTSATISGVPVAITPVEAQHLAVGQQVNVTAEVGQHGQIQAGAIAFTSSAPASAAVNNVPQPNSAASLAPAPVKNGTPAAGTLQGTASGAAADGAGRVSSAVPDPSATPDPTATSSAGDQGGSDQASAKVDQASVKVDRSRRLELLCDGCGGSVLQAPARPTPRPTPPSASPTPGASPVADPTASALSGDGSGAAKGESHDARVVKQGATAASSTSGGSTAASEADSAAPAAGPQGNAAPAGSGQQGFGGQHGSAGQSAGSASQSSGNQDRPSRHDPPAPPPPPSRGSGRRG